MLKMSTFCGVPAAVLIAIAAGAVEQQPVGTELEAHVVGTVATLPEGQQPQSVGPTEARLLVPPPGEGPVVIRAAFHLQDINGIDDEAETFEFSGVLTLVWQDKRQAFDPLKEGVGEKIYQGTYQFDELSPAWYPQVVLANASGLYEKQAVLLRVKPDGTSMLVESINAVAKAKLRLRRYPFDCQRLEAIFEVLGFDTDEVELQAEPVAVSLDRTRIQVPQWNVIGLAAAIRAIDAPYAGNGGSSSAFVLAIDAQRQSFFMLRLVILPLVVIVMLSWSVFWMDRSSLGDRMSVSFVGILTAVAYQFVVGGAMPQISYVTLMNAILSFSFLVMSATVVINLIVGAADRQGEHQRGNRIDCRCRWVFPIVYFGALACAAAIVFFVF